MKSLLNFVTGCGLTRTQTLAAQIMLLLAIFMTLPLQRPVIWVLEEWGGDGEITIPGRVWAMTFAVAGAGILLARSRRSVAFFMVMAAALVATVAVAGVITQGISANTTVMIPTVWHFIGAARDASSRKREVKHAHGLDSH